MNAGKIYLFCLLGLFSLFQIRISEASNAPLVSVSVQPVHSLVAGLMDGVGEPELIIKGGRSPHTYNMKPSDAHTLNHSDIIIWVGPGLEMFLERPIATLSRNSRVITLAKNPEGDPHMWLSPMIAITIIEQVLKVLIENDPKHGEHYKRNALNLTDRLSKLQKTGEDRLRPHQTKPFLVFHDAWGHFAKAFGLSVVGSVAINPERPPGAKRISTIRRQIKQGGIRCLFREPQFQSPLLATLLKGQENIREFELDPLGSAFAPGPNSYFNMMESNFEAVASCLQ